MAVKLSRNYTGLFDMVATGNDTALRNVTRESAISLRDQLIEALKEPEIKRWWVSDNDSLAPLLAMRQSGGENRDGIGANIAGWYVFAVGPDSARARAKLLNETAPAKTLDEYRLRVAR